MAFEQNQQDAFNLRNDTERMKQFEAELDKATTSIGAAEIAAEKELAALKLKNLAVQQEAQIKKLEELLEKEEAGIRKLAALRLELSDKQFEVRKKEIQKELQLIKEAIDELNRVTVKKAEKSEDTTAKQTTNTENIIATTSNTKSIDTNEEKASTKNSGKLADPELLKLVGSIDKTLSSLRDTITTHSQPQEKDGVSNIRSNVKPQQSVTPSTKNVQVHSKDILIEEATISETDKLQQQNTEADKTTIVPDSENVSQPELINLVSSIDRTLESLLSTVANQSKEKGFSASTEAQQTSITKDTQTTTRNTPTEPAEEAPIVNNHEQSAPTSSVEAQPEEKEFSNDGMGNEDRINLGLHTFESIVTGFESLKKTLTGKDTSQTRKDLNSIIKSKKPVAQDKIDAAGELLKSVKAANEAEQKLKEFNEASVLTKRLRAAEEEQKLRQAHADTLYNAAKKSEALAAKAKDIEINKQKYIDEVRLARENAFYEKRNSLAEELVRTETEMAWEREHNNEIMAQELQQKRINDQKAYQEYLKEAGEFAVNQEEFINNKKQKELQESKNKATSGITDAIKSGQFSKIFSTDNKEAISEYMNQRTAELKDSYMTKFDKDNPEATEEERAEAAERAKASAKLSAGFELVADAAKNLAQELNAQTDKIGEKQAPIDTRLQGSQENDKILGSYWKQLARDMNKIGAVNPYFKQENFASNIEALVNKGISFDIKQRAFLMTIQEKIATTFDVADGTLLRLIRIQQQDTTAGRLGMESALNSFLNSMYETSEYLTDVASSVRGSLEELQSLMEGAAGTELEFQIQKWMGSLYSVGMSQDAIQSIAQTFGQIASGDINGLTGDGTSNLLIMAANEAGMSIADILQKGLDADETNKLLQATVNYLAEIAKDSSDSRVVQQQLANVFGMKASDLRAATNLASSVKEVSNQDLTYSGMLGQLNKMANSMLLRTSTGEMLTNVWDNVQYTMATQMANDPILYLLPKVATLLEDYAGGIDLPFINVWGFGLDLNTSVAQLMNVAALSGSILGALGPMISGLSAAVSGSIMLSKAGIDTSGKAPVIARGAPATLQNISGSSISESGYVGNSSGEDVKNATLQDAEDDKKKQMVEAKDESSEADLASDANQAVIDIYNLLEEVAHGTQSLRVHVVGGLTGGSSKEDNGNWVLSF